MNTTTLRGVFPEPRPIHRKNFLKENVKHLKEMQGLIQKESKLASTSQTLKLNKFRNVAPRVYSHINTLRRPSKLDVDGPASQRRPRTPVRTIFPKAKSEVQSKLITNKSVQTERPEDVYKLYETGVIRYPSPSIKNTKVANPTKKLRDQGISAVASPVVQSPVGNRPRIGDGGDAPTEKLAKTLQKLDLEDKHNYIKENIKSIRAKPKKDEKPNPNQAPVEYQKGVLPKYLKGRKEEEEMVKPVPYEGENLSNLVLLPDDERKEYLRVARENYAGLIKELNSMPVSNDTLKRRKRKMEIEQELMRLDEVIKIFQKPKVFVKADA